MSDVLDCFEQQSHVLSCVAACVTMLARRRGAVIAEAQLMAKWGDPPYTLAAQASQHGLFQILDPDSPANFEYLVARVRQSWCLVTTMPVPRRPAHAIVLVEVSADGRLVALDPALARAEQPVILSAEQLVAQWTGELLMGER